MRKLWLVKHNHAKELCTNDETRSGLKRIGIGQLVSFKVVCEEKGKYYATNSYQLLDGKLEEYPDAHRSYLCPGKVQVIIFDNRLEVTSPGMLDKDLTIEKMKMGISKIRNGAIAKVFAYMNMVETWGTGIPKIFEEAKHYGLREPELLDMGSDFRVNLYRKELATDVYGIMEPKFIAKSGELYTVDKENMSKLSIFGTNGTKIGTSDIKRNDTSNNTRMEMEKLISIIREDGRITQKQMSQKTGLSLRTVKRMTAELQKNGKIIRTGNHRTGEWLINEI